MSGRARALVGALVVAGLTALPYLQTLTFDFINFDDYSYIHYSPVAKGLTRESVAWALTDAHTMSNWHPLTYLSYMADVALCGIDAGAMHAVNLSVHALSAAVLFLLAGTLLQRDGEAGRGDRNLARRGCAGWIWIAAAAAALCWSLHPLRVESVAWISSRKDVLSALFCVTGLLAHLGDVRQWWGGRLREVGWHTLLDDAWEWVVSWRWWFSFGCFALGIMAKPTMMVYPAFVALLEWLETGKVRWRALAVYAVGSGVVVAVTIGAQGAGGAIVSDFPLLHRIANAAVAVSIYVRQLVLPYRLTCFYPYDAHLAPLTILSACVNSAVLVGLAVWGWRRLPEVTFALVWFAAALAPVLGLIQVGWASHADRYTHLATLGVSLALARGLKRLLCDAKRSVAVPFTVAAAGVLFALGAATWRQTSVWRDDRSLFERALKTTRGNYLAHRNLGIYAYGREHDCEKAVEQFDAAFRINRERNRATQLSYIFALAESGRLERAKEEARDLSEYKERQVVEAMNKGQSIGERGGPTTRLLDTFLAYAMIAYCEGDKALAREHAETVLGYIKNDENAHYVLGLLARDEGRYREAVHHLKICAETGILLFRPHLTPKIVELELLASAASAGEKPQRE